MEIDRIKIDDVVYYRLYARCPECLEQGRHVNQDFWTHADCGGDIYIGDNATFYCAKCNESIPWIRAEFECPYHNTTAAVGYFISKSVGASLVMNPLLFGESNNRESISFLRKLTSSYDDQLDEFVRWDKIDIQEQ